MQPISLLKRLTHDALGRRLDVAEDRLVASPELAGHHDERIGKQGLAGTPSVPIPGNECVENTVRDLFGDLVRVTLGGRLGGEHNGAGLHAAPSRTKRMVQSFSSAIAFASSTDMRSSAAM